MQRLSFVISGLCAAAVTVASVPGVAAVSQSAPPSAVGTADVSWNIVPEDELRELRGGMDLGPLVAYFGIQREVEVDGVVVARMQIVISNLDRLGNGGMPTISVSGPLAELVQVMNGTGKLQSGAAAQVLTGANAPTAASSAAPVTNAPASAASASTPVSSGGASVVSMGNNGGAVSSTGTGSGSSAQFGNAINTAVAAANGASSSSATSTPALASTGSSGTAATPAAPVSMTAPTKIIPVGNTGQFVVLSNLPNATAITTAVQNEVRGATIQTQTTITATLNSLAYLNAGSLANAIRQQMPAGL